MCHGWAKGDVEVPEVCDEATDLHLIQEFRIAPEPDSVGGVGSPDTCVNRLGGRCESVEILAVATRTNINIAGWQVGTEESRDDAADQDIVQLVPFEEAEDLLGSDWISSRGRIAGSL
jgi:hypothetical protein